jgi:hypothetical protein
VGMKKARKISVDIAEVPTKFQTEHLPNISLDCYYQIRFFVKLFMHTAFNVSGDGRTGMHFRERNPVTVQIQCTDMLLPLVLTNVVVQWPALAALPRLSTDYSERFRGFTQYSESALR